MTPTDEIRRLLDERRVEYEIYEPKYYSSAPDRETMWGSASYREWPDGTVRFSAGGITPEQAIAATLGAGTCREVYLLMATDIGDGREEVLGVYATGEAAMAAINENQFGYAFHHVRKWEVDE